MDFPWAASLLDGGVLLSNEAQKCTRCAAVLFYGLTEPRSRGEQLAPQLPATGVSRPGRKRPTSEKLDDGIRPASRSTRFPRIGFSRPSLQPGRTLWRFDNACSS